jgi:low affinity Fe/Cu permease
MMGAPWAFAAAVALTLVWALSGPAFNFSDTWQLIINTATTVATFLAVFLIQNTQNRDSKALHLKLDELIRGVRGARTGLVDLEDMSDEELEQLRKEFAHIRQKHGVGLAVDDDGDEVIPADGNGHAGERARSGMTGR